MELHDFNSRRLTVKTFAEYHGHRKHLEDRILRQKLCDYPGKEGKRWKRYAGLQYNVFNEHGRIQEVLNFGYCVNIEDEDRLLRAFSEGDQIQFPKLPIHHRIVEDDGPLRSIECARYYI